MAPAACGRLVEAVRIASAVITPAGGALTPAACDSARLLGRPDSRSPPVSERALSRRMHLTQPSHTRTTTWQTKRTLHRSAQKSDLRPRAGSGTRHCQTSARVTPAARCSTTAAGSVTPTAETIGRQRARCARCPAARLGSPGARSPPYPRSSPYRRPDAAAYPYGMSAPQSQSGGWPGCPPSS